MAGLLLALLLIIPTGTNSNSIELSITDSLSQLSVVPSLRKLNFVAPEECGEHTQHIGIFHVISVCESNASSVADFMEEIRVDTHTSARVIVTTRGVVPRLQTSSRTGENSTAAPHESQSQSSTIASNTLDWEKARRMQILMQRLRRLVKDNSQLGSISMQAAKKIYHLYVDEDHPLAIRRAALSLLVEMAQDYDELRRKLRADFRYGGVGLVGELVGTDELRRLARKKPSYNLPIAELLGERIPVDETPPSLTALLVDPLLKDFGPAFEQFFDEACTFGADLEVCQNSAIAAEASFSLRLSLNSFMEAATQIMSKNGTLADETAETLSSAIGTVTVRSRQSITVREGLSILSNWTLTVQNGQRPLQVQLLRGVNINARNDSGIIAEFFLKPTFAIVGRVPERVEFLPTPPYELRHNLHQVVDSDDRRYQMEGDWWAGPEALPMSPMAAHQVYLRLLPSDAGGESVSFYQRMYHELEAAKQSHREAIESASRMQRSLLMGLQQASEQPVPPFALIAFVRNPGKGLILKDPPTESPVKGDSNGDQEDQDKGIVFGDPPANDQSNATYYTKEFCWENNADLEIRSICTKSRAADRKCQLCDDGMDTYQKSLAALKSATKMMSTVSCGEATKPEICDKLHDELFGGVFGMLNASANRDVFCYYLSGQCSKGGPIHVNFEEGEVSCAFCVKLLDIVDEILDIWRTYGSKAAGLACGDEPVCELFVKPLVHAAFGIPRATVSNTQAKIAICQSIFECSIPSRL